MKQLYYAIQMIIRGKDSSVIKIVSLSLGLLISIILFARVAFEFNYDNFYEDTDRLFLVETAWKDDKGMGDYSHYVIFPTAAVIASHFPEQVECQTTFSDIVSSTVIHGTEKYKGEFIMADSLYFQTIGLQLIEGNALELSTPGVIFLSQSFAREVFGSEDPIGKTLVYPLWGDDYPIIVKGIFADIPENTSQLRTTAIVSLSTMSLREKPVNWGWTGGANYRAFVRLKHAKDADIINRGINSIIESSYFPKGHYGKWNLSGIEVTLTPLRGYHLKNENVMRMIRILSLLGLALLLTATLNYALISMSSLSRRAKAVGVHKCNGASAGNIFGMFLWETALLIGGALLLVVFIILNFSEKIEELTQISLKGMFSLENLWAPAWVVLFLFAIGGILPGVTFSSVPVTQVFRRYTEGKKRWKYPLLFFQFGGAAFLAGVMCIVFVQYHYILSKDLGYHAERVVFAYYPSERTTNAVSVLRNLPYVETVACSRLDMMESRSPYDVKDANGNYMFSPRVNWFEKDFFSFIGLRIKAGRMPVKDGEILINDEFAKKMGWDSNGVGERVSGHGTVTGIIDGYYFMGVSRMPPLEIQCVNGGAGCLHVRLKEPFADNKQRLNTEMKKLYPQDEIYFKSYDDMLQSRFQSTRIFRDSTLLACVAILAIMLMGLVGYTDDEVRRRTKEIAIRKINGAGLGSILYLLLKDVVLIAIPAILAGILLAGSVGKIWQAQFNDVSSIPPVLYIGVAVAVLVFIMGSVIMKSWKTANENPVKNIKIE